MNKSKQRKRKEEYRKRKNIKKNNLSSHLKYHSGIARASVFTGNSGKYSSMLRAVERLSLEELKKLTKVNKGEGNE